MSQDYTTGQRLGDYEILGVLGAGGMGKVYKVRNVISDRVEAMKILLPNLASEKELADRFLREIKLLATLHHPNIAALRTALTLDNQLVMIMEYVDGVTLSSRLHQGAIPPADAINYVDQVLAALSYAHKLNIVHRDIKPANMMLTSDGTVKLMDFGIARSGGDRSLTTTGTTLGSLNYMPPEQVKGEPADARSDIYSLGVSLYEMVTGMLPFEAASNYSLMAAHIEQAPKAPIIHKPGLPDSLNQIILMALAKDPAQRFQSADAFRAALKTVDVASLKPAPSGTTMPAAWTSPYASGSGADETMAVNTPAPELAHGAVARASVAGGTGTAATSATAASQAGSTASPTAGVVPPVAAASSKRGLYMGLGALVVVGVLFAAGFYLPRRSKINAGENKAAFPSQQSSGGEKESQNTVPPSSATAGATGTTTPSSTGTQPASAVPDTPSSPAPDTPAAGGSGGSRADSAAAGSMKHSGRNAQDSADSQGVPATAAQRRAVAEKAQAEAEAAAAATAQAQAAAAELQEAQAQDDQMTARASAVSASLDTLKRQQSGQGYGLRGDVVGAEQRMQTYMSKAQAALQHQDGPAAKKYFEQADREITFLEKFLGR
jgi:eukaryotic-like serine/threonine-protein kinase